MNKYLTEIVVAVVLIALSIAGIYFVADRSRSGAKTRAFQRAGDLRNLKVSVEENLHPGSYPITFTKKLSSQSTYQSESNKPYYVSWYNECDRLNNWIPGFENLPADPSKSCENQQTSGVYPRYQYASDGYDYKIVAYKLSGEVCSESQYAELIDPVRSCKSYEPSWAVYSSGARNW